MQAKGYDPHTRCEPHETTGCAFCTGTYTCLEELAPKPAKAAKVKRARKDGPMTTAELVAAGKMCGICRTLYAPIGCKCTLKARYDRLAPDCTDWLEEHHLEFDTGKRNSHPELIAAGLVFTTQARQARRAGVMAAQPGFVQDAARLAILTRFGVEPKWAAPRTQEANRLPV